MRDHYSLLMAVVCVGAGVGCSADEFVAFGADPSSPPEQRDAGVALPVTQGGASNVSSAQCGLGDSPTSTSPCVSAPPPLSPSAEPAHAAEPTSNAPPLTPGSPATPDLVLDGAYLRDTTAQDYVDIEDACLVSSGCTTGIGMRRVVRFGTRTGNAGGAGLVMGAPGAGNPFWSFDTCHMTFHMQGYVRYELIVPETRAVVLVGTKSGFCMRDSEPWDVNDTEISCHQFDCDNQGITPGCADNYGSDLQCQWVDITNIPLGVYDLRVTINANLKINELDYTNDVVTLRIQIGATDVSLMP